MLNAGWVSHTTASWSSVRFSARTLLTLFCYASGHGQCGEHCPQKSLARVWYQATIASPISAKTSGMPCGATCPTVTQRHAICLYIYAVRLHALEMNVYRWDTLHRRKKSLLCGLRHFNILQIGFPFVNWLHADTTRLRCPLLAAWRHNKSAHAHYVAKSAIKVLVRRAVPFLFKCPCTLRRVCKIKLSTV
jgi:hypothetical protein